MGHTGPNALKHLVNTTQCDACGISKIREQVSRKPRDTGEKPGDRPAIDFHDFPPHEGIESMMLCDEPG